MVMIRNQNKKCDWGKEKTMPYKDKDRKTWIAQWFEEDIMGEKVRKRKRGFRRKKLCFFVKIVDMKKING